MINPKELMLGNWVYESERSQFPMQVVNIDKDMVYLDFDSNEGDVFDGRMEDICPIPVTVDFLKNNGFIESVYVRGKYHNFDIPTDDEFTILQTIGEGFSVYIFGMLHEIKYVHQLQNILTIAGIDIDFKI